MSKVNTLDNHFDKRILFFYHHYFSINRRIDFQSGNRNSKQECTKKIFVLYSECNKSVPFMERNLHAKRHLGDASSSIPFQTGLVSFFVQQGSLLGQPFVRFFNCVPT